MCADFWCWLNANGGAVTAAATVVAALIAAGALVSAAVDTNARSRPALSAEFRLAPHAPTVLELLVQNYGQSIASKIGVTFVPPLERSSTTEVVTDRYASEVSVLGPGQQLVNTWYVPTYTASGELAGNAYGFPDRITMIIRYRGGWWRYKTTILLDVNSHLHTSQPVNSSSLLGSVRRIAERLETIAGKL